MRTATDPARKLTLADHIDAATDTLVRLRQIAGNERRTHAQTDELIDGLEHVGLALRRMARG